MSLHVAFLAPEYPSDQILFVRALKRMGARVSGIGHVDRRYLGCELQCLLDDYERVRSVGEACEVEEAARRIDLRRSLDRLESVQELQVRSAARARAALSLPGTSVRTAHLCRDKVAMKDELRRAGIPCADSRAGSTPQQAREAAERIGFPLVIKPRGGYGGLETFRVEAARELERALVELQITPERPAVLEEFVEGPEGFIDALVSGGEVAHEFLASYRPNVLEALSRPDASPSVVSTNRVEAPAHRELRQMARRVVTAMGLTDTATHLEWIEGPDGLRISEIAARPPGERLWELHAVGNDLDLHLEWASILVQGRTDRTPSRRFATGSVQIRPDRQGRVQGYDGLGELRERCGPWIFSSQILTRGYPTTPFHLGYLGNSWFRLFHPDYDELSRMVDWIGSTVHMLAA